MHKLNFYTNKKQWKVALFITAIIIGVLSLWYTGQLVRKMEIEERKNMEIWAEAQAALASTDDLNQEIKFYLNIITKNTTIPVILVDDKDSILTALNIKKSKEGNIKYLYHKLEKMKEGHEPFIIKLYGSNKNYIYYEDSTILKQLSIYPYIQLGVISLFILIAYLAFSSSRKSEQNQVWVGMSKETAHQLGTPISSLMAWVELLKMKNVDENLIQEFEKDTHRLQKITERFSKIGSIPELIKTDVAETVTSTVEYLKTRSSSNVKFIIDFDATGKYEAPLNAALFSWVIENLCKNAIDAMNSNGTIHISLVEKENQLSIEVSDTGKGISKQYFKTVFQPGFTTKKRGWGLGLSLAKRIIENYHKGKIFLKQSEINKGTTFKIILNKG